jgi:hypothetical protein
MEYTAGTAGIEGNNCRLEEPDTAGISEDMLFFHVISLSRKQLE